MTPIPMPTMKVGGTIQILAMGIVLKNYNNHSKLGLNLSFNHLASLKLGLSLEDIMKSMENNTKQFQQETRANIQKLGTQVSQMVISISKLKANNQGRLPS